MKKLAKKLVTATAVCTAMMFPGAASAQYGPVPGELPGLVLFDGSNFKGDVREFSVDVERLNNIGFNDRARSIKVLDGTWELCEDSRYRGRCIVVKYDVDRLHPFGLGDEISSVRRISDIAEVDHLTLVERDKYGQLAYVYEDPYYHDQPGYYDRPPTTVYSRTTVINRNHYGHRADPFGYHSYGYGYRHDPFYGGHYERRRPPPPQRIGARNGAVKLYTDPGLRGREFGINQNVRDLSKWRFNDSITSIEINEGTWELCEHSNFRGKCRVVNADQHSLAPIGLNDNVSSIRRIDQPAADARRGPRPGRGEGRGNGRNRGHHDAGSFDRNRGPIGLTGNSVNRAEQARVAERRQQRRNNDLFGGPSGVSEARRRPHQQQVTAPPQRMQIPRAVAPPAPVAPRAAPPPRVEQNAPPPPQRLRRTGPAGIKQVE